MPDAETIGSFLAALFGGGVIGGLVAAYAANKYAQARDRKARRIEFMRLLGEWRTAVYRCQTGIADSADFPAHVARFGGDYVAIESDLWCWQRSKFHAMCEQIIAMADPDVEQTGSGVVTGRTQLLKRIEVISSFLGRH